MSPEERYRAGLARYYAEHSEGYMSPGQTYRRLEWDTFYSRHGRPPTAEEAEAMQARRIRTMPMPMSAVRPVSPRAPANLPMPAPGYIAPRAPYKSPLL